MPTTKTYQPLEGNMLKAVGGTAPSFTDGATPSFFTSASFLYSFFFVIIVVAASGRYMFAGILRMSATEDGIRKSKEEMWRVTKGLLGVFGLWLILFTVNKDLLTGNVGLDNLRTSTSTYAQGGSMTTGSVAASTGSGSTQKCDDVAVVKAAVSTNGAGICANTTCGLPQACLTNNPYFTYIKTQSDNLGVPYKMIVATMCKESGGNPLAKHNNGGNSWDCGLMQINQQGECSSVAPTPAEINANILAGITLMKTKIDKVSNAHVYPSLKLANSRQTAAFTSYNCCANDTVTNDPSSQGNDSSGNPLGCKVTDGWPEIPKWACPVNPGTGAFNMCGVKAYACELTACMQNVP